MKFQWAFLALAAVVHSNPYPQGVTRHIAPKEDTPANCSSNASGSFGMNIVRLRGVLQRKSLSDHDPNTQEIHPRNNAYFSSSSDDSDTDETPPVIEGRTWGVVRDKRSNTQFDLLARDFWGSDSDSDADVGIGGDGPCQVVRKFSCSSIPLSNLPSKWQQWREDQLFDSCTEGTSDSSDAECNPVTKTSTSSSSSRKPKPTSIEPGSDSCTEGDSTDSECNDDRTITSKSKTSSSTRTTTSQQTTSTEEASDSCTEGDSTDSECNDSSTSLSKTVTPITAYQSPSTLTRTITSTSTKASSNNPLPTGSNPRWCLERYEIRCPHGNYSLPVSKSSRKLGKRSRGPKHSTLPRSLVPIQDSPEAMEIDIGQIREQAKKRSGQSSQLVSEVSDGQIFAPPSSWTTVTVETLTTVTPSIPITTLADGQIEVLKLLNPERSTLTYTTSIPAIATASSHVDVSSTTKSKSDKKISKRQNSSPGSSKLQLQLHQGILTDKYNRTGYIASNYQFQFDAPPQSGAIYTAGWSMCGNQSLALGDSATFYACRSGDFYNLYDRNWAPQCEPVALQVI